MQALGAPPAPSPEGVAALTSGSPTTSPTMADRLSPEPPSGGMTSLNSLITAGRKLLQSTPQGVQIALNIQSPSDLSTDVQQAIQAAVSSGQFQAALIADGEPASTCLKVSRLCLGPSSTIVKYCPHNEVLTIANVPAACKLLSLHVQKGMKTKLGRHWGVGRIDLL